MLRVNVYSRHRRWAVSWRFGVVGWDELGRVEADGLLVRQLQR